MSKLFSVISMYFLCIVFLVGCSEYDSAMKKGKAALKAEDYQEAISQFNIAIIERPQDKDAEILLEKSEENHNKQLASKGISDYIDKINSPVNNFGKVLESNLSIENFTDQELENQLASLDSIVREVNEVTPVLNNNPILKDVHAILVQSVSEYNDGATTLKNILPEVKEYIKNKQSDGKLRAIPNIGVIVSIDINFTNARNDFNSYINRLSEIQQGNNNNSN
ncbi:MAG: hypothetical protein E7E23_16540 [Paenibacillus sp.]|uniref:hypothetical protein n=1 Tax=Paenibacillus sp. TaxID=58172 RepID=UPI002904974A|nr:hypothetical protein [Paenibacillus sp.]MDU2242177.1 hypothetical protein [Paenibacillus sp.]